MLYQGTTKKGFNYVTRNQSKKHITQMTNEEKNYLSKVIANIDIDNMNYSKHSVTKLNVTYAKNIINSILLDKAVLNNIVELNINRCDEGYVREVRVLVRDKNIYRVKMLDCNTGIESVENANLCIVYSITNNSIVTAYWNKANDDHKSINWCRYDAGINILNYKSLMAGELLDE